MDVEQRARELLADEYAKGQFRAYAPEIRSGVGTAFDEEIRAIVAIISALTPSEGYVLVPISVLRDAYAHIEREIYFRGGDSSTRDALADALSASQEVKNVHG
ncbi:hypothetical protein [Stenotrophomonas maltophilia]|uniref:hypothetical protein n=1 Tax=Stenotrophomonas maltophilia TaxID=40324 RepID=UPI003BF7F97B